MPLSPAERLGPYEIVAKIGAGGMGEVYKARDTRLDRTVAIKVSAEPFTARFEREARAVAALNHPNVCTLYDIGPDYLVMEYLDGPALSDSLAKGPLPLDRALAYAVQIADALNAAHRKGIIHRDLKPANVILTNSGAKLLDFGVAGTAIAESREDLATRTSALTLENAIIGSLPYMSPEQVEGKRADARSDIWALGALVYEMVTGKRPFDGNSAASAMSAILTTEPAPMESFRPEVAPALEHAVRTALAKNPDERWQDVADLGLQLKWIAEGDPAGAPAAVHASRTRRWLPWAAACLAVCALAAAALFALTSRKPAPVITAQIPPPDSASFRLTGNQAGPVTVSPDGKSVAFVAAMEGGKPMLWLRPLNELRARALPGTEDAKFPFWSPQNRALGFFANGKLKIVEIAGGSPASICDAPDSRGGTWGGDGAILFTPGSRRPIFRVPASGGVPQQVTRTDAADETTHRWPHFLPDGKHFLYIAANHADPENDRNNKIYFASLDGKENRVILRSPTNAVYASGYLLFVSADQRLLAQEFDPEKGRFRGEPVRVADGVYNDVTVWRGAFDASQTGVLAYAGGDVRAVQLAWFDRAGRQLETVGKRMTGIRAFRLSPDEQRLGLAMGPDIWVEDLKRDSRLRLTFGPRRSHYPVWSRDGKWIAYAWGGPRDFNVYRKPADGTGAEQLLLHSSSELLDVTDYAPDGKSLLYTCSGPRGSWEIWRLPVTGGGPTPVVQNGLRATGARSSPDGRWIAYKQEEGEAYIVPASGGPGRWQITTGGVGSGGLRWRRDGKEIFYTSLNDVLMAVPLSFHGGAVHAGTPQALFPLTAGPFVTSYDPSADGQRFLINISGRREDTPLVVISNWTAVLAANR